jgi:hypothetical protein
MTAALVLAAMELAAFFVLFLAFRKKIRRLSGLEGRLSTLRDEVEALAADFGEVSERNIGVLEDRIAVLRDLVNRAELPGRPEPEEGGAESSGPIVLELGHGGSSAPGSGREASGASISARPARTEALDLCRAGFSPETIAARLGLSVAEVELIVGLEERRGA